MLKKKKLMFVMFVLVMGSVIGFSQSTEKIIEKMVEAKGGAKLLASVKDSTTTASIEIIQQGITAPTIIYQKEPNKVKIEFEAMGMKIVQAYDGKIAWTKNPQSGVQELPEAFAKKLKRGSYTDQVLFLDYKKFGISYSYKGKEKINEINCLVLERIFSDNHKVLIYVDRKTYLILKTAEKSIDQMGGEVSSENYFSDYKKYDGITYATKVSVLQDGKENQKITFKKRKINTEIKDSIFSMKK